MPRVQLSGAPSVDKRLLLAVPSYGHLEPSIEKDLRVALMVAARHGVTWLGDASPDRMSYSAGRNAVAQACLDFPECDGVLWVDSDVKVPSLAILKLLIDAEAFGAEFITGIYHQRAGNHCPLIAQYNSATNKFAYYTEWEENVMAPVDGCGFGFCYTARVVFQRIAEQPDFGHGQWFPDTRDVEGGLSEDFNFCLKAKRAGIQLWVTTAVQLGHAGEPEIVTRENFLAARAKREAESAA